MEQNREAVFIGQSQSRTVSGLILLWVSAALVAVITQVGCGSGPPQGLSIQQDNQGGVSLVSLSHVPVPQAIGGDVVDNAAAIRLGKALFWDQQLGSDGKQSCASCHYQAGVDSRTFNVVNPGPSGVFNVAGITGPGQMFSLSMITSDNRIGSQGVFAETFVGIDPDPAVAADICTSDPLAAPFWAFRGVTGRNTPSAIGAIFNRQNFWDGRANDVFNGQNPFGLTANAGVKSSAGPMRFGRSSPDAPSATLVFNGSSASVAAGMGDGSAASQSVGPPLSGVEMSCAGRQWNGVNSLGTKMLARQPLQLQVVAADDSVLGMMSNWPDKGLQCDGLGTPCTYSELIATAFGQAMADAAEMQFSRIFGQAIQAYEATLIPDKTPFDQYLDGKTTAMTAAQKRGLDVFTGKASCTKCHNGAELSDATISFAQQRGLINEDGGDQGFHNTGVRPTQEDLGRAGLGPNGAAWSQSGSRMDRGAFKTPGLRNLKLTAPYFHNGGTPTIAAVVDFYARGGDFKNPELSKRMKPISLSARDKSDLVDFLANGLTDCRVEQHAAPFDHPSLQVTDGPNLAAAGAQGFGPCK
jgi:cytochrome c peroxidase